MNQEKKLLGEKRRKRLLELLQNAREPLTGNALAKQTGVSRQVIVQDVALLKARDEAIIATPQGYVYMKTPEHQTVQRVVAVRHDFEETELELNTFVDHGVMVRDVIVEHPIYGEINGSLMIRTREDVERFIQKVQVSHASLLSSLTGGVHLHTIEASAELYLNQACAALEKEGILLNIEE